jgi:hypothetical protein
VLDPLALITVIVPFLVLFGLSLLTMTLVHLGLSESGNRFPTEISTVVGLLLFIGTELVLGTFEISWTLLMLLLVTPLIVYESAKPQNGETESPVLLDTFKECGDVLCFSVDSKFAALAALKITNLPVENKPPKSKEDADDELKILHPLWENSKQSRTTYTIETRVVGGLVELSVFVLSKGKEWQSTIEKAKQSREVTETWLSQMDYSYEVLSRTRLEEAYRSIDTGSAGTARADGIPKRLSGSLGLLLQRMSARGVDGSVQVSFTAGSIPHLSKGSGIQNGNPEKQPRIPHRVEDHNLRSVYKQMVEIEACEETGVFRCGMNIIVHGESTLRQAESIIKSVWSNVKVRLSPIGQAWRNWNRYLLRNQTQGTASMSGARLYALLDLSEPLPGVPRCVTPPEFLLPILDSDTSDMVPIGSVMLKRRKLDQVFRIPKDHFCHHVGLYGGTGSGKTNTVKHLLDELNQLNVPFLVLDPSTSEFRELCERAENLRVFTAGDEDTAPFRFNPFHVLPGVPIHKHIENLATCFIAYWPTEGILVEHIMKVFKRAYALAGWDSLTNTHGRTILLSDLTEAKEMVISELEYSSRLNQELVGAFKARFESVLDDPILAVMLNTKRGITIPELLRHPTVLELRNFSESKVGLVTSLLLVNITEYLETQGRLPDQELKHVLVLEEAHHVLKQVNTAGGLFDSHAIQQQAINSIVQLLREARGYGLGTIILDQSPGDLATAAVKLPGITITHFLKDSRERALVGSQANLTEDQIRYIGVLKKGEAIVHSGFSEQAVNVQIPHFKDKYVATNQPWTDERVVQLMKAYYSSRPYMKKQQLPMVESWKPDPVVLWNLKYIIESPDFLREFKKYIESSSEVAEAFVYRVVSNHLETSDAETQHYVTELMEYLTVESNLVEGLDEGF